MSSATTTLLVGIFMLLIGAIGAWMTISKVLKCTQILDATITDVQRTRVKSGSGRKRNDYSPVLTYKVGSEEFSSVADISSMLPNKFVVGETMTIKYDPNEPSTFCVKGKSGTLK